MDALWGYEESHAMDQLEHNLLFTPLELEKLKSEAMEQMRKKNDYINQLIHLLKYAIQERDEAQNHLQNLLNNSKITIMPPQADHRIPLFQLPVKKPNSSVTESNSVGSLFDTVISSPDLSNIFVQECNKVDEGTLVIDNLVKGKSLPKRGKFLQAVIEAGPLLQTILVAGPLPRWRNPPQLREGGDVIYRTPATSGGPLLAYGMINNSSGYNTTLAKRQRFSSY